MWFTSSSSIPRPYVRSGLQDASRVEVHVFCDASDIAISAVAYFEVFDGNHTDVGFLLGKSKLAPEYGHTISGLKLCAA